MIERSTLVKIGATLKPHGIKGELTIALDDDLSPEDFRCLLLDIDGIIVPFFAETVRSKGDNWLVKFDGIDNEDQATELARHDIYAERDELDIDEDSEDGVHLFDLIDYTVATDNGPLGIIEDIDDSTANILFHISAPDGKTIYIPYAEEFITGLDIQNHTIYMALPEGICDLNR